MKGFVHHQRGNSDGIQNLTTNKMIPTIHHTRGSSGSGGQLRTFEEHLDGSSHGHSHTIDFPPDQKMLNPPPHQPT